MGQGTVASILIVLTILVFQSYGVSGTTFSEKNIPAIARKAGGTFRRWPQNKDTINGWDFNVNEGNQNIQTSSIEPPLQSTADKIRSNLQDFVSKTFLQVQVGLESEEIIDKGASGKTLSEMNIPVAARKAGGTLKRNFLPDTEDAINGKNLITENEGNENIEASEGTVLNANKMENEGETGGSDESDSSYQYDTSDEHKCSWDQYWHVRGLRCVPTRCPGGNRLRDKDTGECSYIPLTFRYQGRMHRPYRSNIFRHNNKRPLMKG